MIISHLDGWARGTLQSHLLWDHPEAPKGLVYNDPLGEIHRRLHAEADAHSSAHASGPLYSRPAFAEDAVDIARKDYRAALFAMNGALLEEALRMDPGKGATAPVLDLSPFWWAVLEARVALRCSSLPSEDEAQEEDPLSR